MSKTHIIYHKFRFLFQFQGHAVYIGLEIDQILNVNKLTNILLKI